MDAKGDAKVDTKNDANMESKHDEKSGAKVDTTMDVKLDAKVDATKVDAKVVIRGNLGSKMGLIRKCANNKLCELEFKNQYNFNKMSQP